MEKARPPSMARMSTPSGPGTSSYGRTLRASSTCARLTRPIGVSAVVSSPASSTSNATSQAGGAPTCSSKKAISRISGSTAADVRAWLARRGHRLLQALHALHEIIGLKTHIERATCEADALIGAQVVGAPCLYFLDDVFRNRRVA